MDSRGHGRAKELFLEICDLPREQRGAFLDRHCAGEPEIRREIESLLTCYESEPPPSPKPTVLDGAGGSASPARVGNYRLLQRLGEGGMGDVYEAEQERPMRRRVALKLIKWGMDTREVVARFESERQALALMDHPNIARVLDGGATEQGRPYFVMEFVRGVPITEYCDANRLDTRGRLVLFLRVCDGVQHAHHRGIIHRDIKPSNVLVALQDSTPVPKIIDFGIAKAIDRRLTEGAFHTELGRVIGTPAYMSPEQAELTRLDIDTRTDVYSLGVLLYELLVGVLPFEPNDAGVPLDEIRRRIREDEPTRPSDRVTTRGATAGETAARRSTDAASLARLLRGDLDWIVMKALEKDRTRRYATPSELASDIRRFLEEEPVLARPPSHSYRIRKFVRRNRVAVSVAAGFATVLALGVAGLAYGLVEAVRARSEAQQESRTAAEVAEFLVGLFEVSDPDGAGGSTITAREILDRGARRIETDLADEPVVQARMMATMGSVYRGLGMYDRAGELLERALELHERNAGPTDHFLVETLFDLGYVSFLRGDLQRSRECADRCLELAARLYTEDDPRWAKVLAGVAIVDRRSGRVQEAREGLRRAIAIFEGAPGHAEPFYGYALDEMVDLLRERGELDAARETAERAMGFRERVLGPNHPSIAAGLDVTAGVLEQQGNLRGALELEERVLEIEERTLGPDHPYLHDTLIKLGALRRRAGEEADSMPLFQRAIRICEDRYGAGSPNHVDALYRVAAAIHGAGDLVLARRYYEEALAVVESHEPHWYHTEPNLFGDYGNLLLQTGDPAGARKFYERGLSSAQARGGLQDPLLPVNAGYLGEFHERRGEWEEALRYYALQLEAREVQHQPDDPRIASALLGLASVEWKTGDYVACQPLHARALGIQEKALGASHPEVARLTYNLACIDARRGDREGAIAALRRALERGFRWAGARTDEDFASLRGDPEFEAIVAEMSRRE